jgi:hypothetical protein
LCPAAARIWREGGRTVTQIITLTTPPPAAVLFACLITFGFGNLEEPENR